MLESRFFVVRYCIRWLLVGVAVTWSAVAPALGLGDITVHSALNQPLRADIALVDAAGLEESELSVILATADEFSRAGVERVFFLNNLKFTPVLRGNRSLIQVTSNKPVNEPFLNFLVQLNQPNGRLLREYTVLIDPPGSPEIVPATEEPVVSRPSSAFPNVQPAVAPPPARKEPPKPAVAPAADPLAEKLAAAELQNQQLQASVDELKAKLQAQDEQIAADKKQLSELQTRLAEIQQAAAKPATPEVVTPPPVVVEEPRTDWLTIFGLLAAGVLLLLAWFIRHRRQADQRAPEPAAIQQPSHAVAPLLPAAASAHDEETPTGDVLEAVGVYLTYGRLAEAIALLREAMVKEPQRTDLSLQLLEVLGKQGDVTAYDVLENDLLNAGVDAQKLQDIRARHPKLGPVAPIAEPAPLMAPMEASGDEFQLNLDDLSMDTSWDLADPFEDPSSAVELSNEPALPEAEIEWQIDTDAPSEDDRFLDDFTEPQTLLELEPLKLEPDESASAEKLEQAQTCIDDGDLDSAIELLNELLREADEPMKQTARSLLAGIR